MKKIEVEEASRKPPVSLGPPNDPEILEKKSSVKADIRKTFVFPLK